MESREMMPYRGGVQDTAPLPRIPVSESIRLGAIAGACYGGIVAAVEWGVSYIYLAYTSGSLFSQPLRFIAAWPVPPVLDLPLPFSIMIVNPHLHTLSALSYKISGYAISSNWAANFIAFTGIPSGVLIGATFGLFSAVAEYLIEKKENAGKPVTQLDHDVYWSEDAIQKRQEQRSIFRAWSSLFSWTFSLMTPWATVVLLDVFRIPS